MWGALDPLDALLGRGGDLGHGCAVRSSDADMKHAPAPATTDDKPPGTMKVTIHG